MAQGAANISYLSPNAKIKSGLYFLIIFIKNTISSGKKNSENKHFFLFFCV